MPALFAYILALVVLLGVGYEGLEWLAEPLPAPSHDSGIRPAGKSKLLAGKTETHPDVADGRHASDLEPLPSVAPSEPTKKAATETPSDDEPRKNPKIPAEDPAKTAGDVSQGGCTPIGITAQGKLVFPMECQAILSQKRDNQTAPQPNSAASTPPAKQAQTAAGPEASPSNLPPKQNDPPAQSGPPASNANVKSENEPNDAHVMTSDKESADHEAVKKKRMTARDRPSHPKGVMMILRTIEYPDGHREQRLLSMNQWRRTAYQVERW